MCQVEDVALDATWQKDGNVFCFNLYIDLDTSGRQSEKFETSGRQSINEVKPHVSKVYFPLIIISPPQIKLLTHPLSPLNPA
jgi:hypothetical protein